MENVTSNRNKCTEVLLNNLTVRFQNFHVKLLSQNLDVEINALILSFVVRKQIMLISHKLLVTVFLMVH